ncbi:MAG TPA: cobalamin-binding protein [Burkholderiaceae bacterium]|nr:cobalamin-binding protein [Burkholderiaceae bacterium]
MIATGSAAKLILTATLAVAAGSGQPDKSPRVITLAPHATELIHAAGAGHTLVGTVSSSDFPESARELPRVGDGILLNQERIITLKPTVLVGWLPSNAARQIEPVAHRLGAQLTYSRPLSLRDIPAEVLRLGRLLGTEDQAARAAGELEARIDALERRYASQSPVKVFIEVGERPLYTIGDDPLLNDALRLCSAVNIYAATGLPAPRVPVESVLVNQPELIVVSERPGVEASAARERWSQLGLSAALQGHVHLADPDALYRPGPRLIDATEALCAAVDAARSGLKQSGDAPIK